MGLDKNLTLLTTKPFTRIRDRIVADKELSRIITESPFVNFEDTFEVQKASSQLFQSAYLHVVTETVHDYPNVFLSEKSFKPIVNKRPFVIVGSVHCLKNLQNLGFKTFSDFWDEGYDDIQDPVDRIYHVVKIIEDITSKTIEELRHLLKEMENILEYNHEYYFNHFENNELEKLDRFCLNNLGIRQ